MNRRNFLKTTTAGATAGALAGCTQYIPFIGGDGDDEDDNGTQNDSGEPEGNDTQPSRSTSEDNETNDTANESGNNTSEGDGTPQPSEEETSTNKSEYDEEYGERETTDRPESDIEVESSGQRHSDGSATVTVTVTNVSDASIGTVDLEIVYYGPNDQYLDADIATITDLGAGESEKRSVTATPSQLQGDLERVQVNPDAYDD